MLAARPGPVNRAWSDRVLPFGPNVGGVDRRAGPVDLIACMEFGQQQGVELVPHAGLVQARNLRQQVMPEP